MIGIRTARLLNKLIDLQIYFSKFPKIDWRDSRSLLPPVHPLLGTSSDALAWLTNDEISLLIEMKEADFLSEIMLVAGRLESITISMTEYAKRYDELYRMIPPPVSIKETLASHDLTKEEVLKLQPYSIQLFELINALMSMVEENVPLMKKLAQEYHPMMKRRFPGEKFISLSLADNEKTRNPPK